MTATEKLKQKLIHMMTGETVTDPATLGDRLDQLAVEFEVGDCRSELRGSGAETGLPCPHSRHYECKAVAAQMLDGSWVGWNYWYGGGKHGEPRSMPWMEDAYDVTVETVMKPVQVFRKVEGEGQG